jgi:hypothetical protein
MHEEDISLVSVSPLNDEESSFTVSYLEPPSPTASANDLSIQNPTAQCGDACLAYATTAVSKKPQEFSGV